MGRECSESDVISSSPMAWRAWGNSTPPWPFVRTSASTSNLQKLLFDFQPCRSRVTPQSTRKQYTEVKIKRGEYFIVRIIGINHFKSHLVSSHFISTKMKQSASEDSNFQLFREILSSLIIEKCTTSSASSKPRTKARKTKAGRKTAIKPVSRDVTIEEEEKNDAEELCEFIDVCYYFQLWC